MWNLRTMAALLGSHPENYLPEHLADKMPAGVTFDSRQVKADDLFVCLRGRQQDGHDFAAQAGSGGALAVLAERDPFAGQTPPLAVLRVEDTGAALRKLAQGYRQNFRGKVVGVTGSAGKTSVKEVLAAVLARRGLVSRTFMNQNNQLGLPISLLNAATEALFWVLEAGISQSGDMDILGPLLKPDLAVILNVGPAHLSGLKDRGVAWHKARLLAHLQLGGMALVSADYPDLIRESRAIRGTDLFFFSAGQKDAHYSASFLGSSEGVGGRYLVRLGQESFESTVPFRGAYAAENVAAIAGAAHLLGLGSEEIRIGLAEAALPAQRFHCTSKNGLTLIDDSYNANPLSAIRMLQSAAEIAAENSGPLVLVLGELLELGEDSRMEHQCLGRALAASGSSLIFWKGGQKEAVREGLRQGGFQGDFTPLRGTEDFVAALPQVCACLEKEQGGLPRGAILFKASRGQHLELFVDQFRTRYFSLLHE